MKTGTLSLADLRANKQTTAADFGLENIGEVVQAALDVHNRITGEMLGEMAEVSTDRQRLSGGETDAAEMMEVDEFSRAPTQKAGQADTVGFPLKKYQYPIGWTDEWFRTHTPSEMVEQLDRARLGHVRSIRREIQRAMFRTANYTFRDRLVAPQVDLAVKRFTNADSAPIPLGPNGEVYDGATHQHYLANATLTAGAVTSLVDTLLEHGLDGGRLILAINATDRTAVEALAGFKAYPDPRINYVATDQNRATIDLSRMDNLAIGTFGAAEVWVKPWAIANYVAGYVANGATRPLVFRQRPGTGMQGLRVAARLSAFPLNAEYMEADFGVGVWNRTKGGVLYFAGGAYTDPSL